MAKPYRVLLTVPGGADVPEWYTSAAPEDIATALQLGASLFGTLQALKLRDTDTVIADLEEKNQAELKRISAAATATQQRLQQELQALNAAKSQLQQKHAEEMAKLSATHSTALEEERLLAQRNARTAFESQIARLQEQSESLQSRLKLLDEQRSADIHFAEQRTVAAMNLVLEEKQRAIDRLEKDRERLAASVDTYSQELKFLTATLATRRAQTTKEKGGDFEMEFRDRLIQAFGTGQGFALQTTAAKGVGHAGDHMMNWGDKTILWEVKDYDKPVPTQEIEKFHRDMKENPTTSIGVMVSRSTYITGKSAAGPKHIEFMNDQMLIYLSEFDRMPTTTLQDLMLLFKMFWYANRNFESKETIEAAIRNIERLHKEATQAKLDWRVHKSRNDDMMRWISEHVESTEERLRYALRDLQGMNESTPFQIPEGIFRDATGEEKKLELIRVILDIAEAAPGESCVLNDLANIVSEKVHLSRDTVKSHIRDVLLDESFTPPRGNKPARILGLRIKAELSGAFLTNS